MCSSSTLRCCPRRGWTRSGSSRGSFRSATFASARRAASGRVDAAADVRTAGSAKGGVALVQSFRPDVIVSDIGMPDQDGHQFMHQVRALAADNGGRTPAVALTAFARSEDRTRAMNAGYQAHVPKPVEAQELVATVRSLAGHYRDR